MIGRYFKFWPILLLVLLTVLLRVYKLEDFFYFTYDESIPAFIGRRLILWHHIPLIGAVTPLGFHLGPYFYWILTAILYVGKLNPVAWGWAGAVISTATALLTYVVGKELFNKKVGFIASTLWAFSYLANIYDRHFWALYWSPLVSLITFYCLLKVAAGRYKYVFLLVPTLTFAIHSDLSNLNFVFLSAAIWLLYKIPIRKELIISLLIFVFSFVPLAIFDLRHNFANISPTIDYFRQGRSHQANNPQNFIENSLLFPKVFSRLIFAQGPIDVPINYTYCWNLIFRKFSTIPTNLVLALLIMLIIFIASTIRKRNNKSLLSANILIYFFSIQVFGTLFRSDVFEHYLAGLFPTFIIIFSYYISILPKKTWIIALALIMSLNLWKLFNSYNPHGLSYKRQAINFAMLEVGNKDFSLDSLSTCWKYSGYRYLFAVFGKEPIKSYVDPNFAYLYGTTPVAQDHPNTVVSFVTHDFLPETDSFHKRYSLLKSHEIKSGLFGNVEVIIMDNSKKWFY